MRRFLPLLLIPAAQANALAGAWEQFPTQSNADGWSLFAYADEFTEPPLWEGTETNPYAYSFFIGGEGVWFFADEFTAQQAFVGDYATQKISGIDVSVSVDPAEIDYIDLAVYADGPLGPGYYYSLIYVPEDLGIDPDWYPLSFSFAEDWFYFDGTDFEPFKPDGDFLSSIGEVGIRVFPVEDVGESAYVGIDDFILVPSVTAPTLAPSQSDGRFHLDFTPNPGVAASIETLSAGGSWQLVPGESDLTGPQSFSIPLNDGTELFRVVTEERLTPVVTP